MDRLTSGRVAPFPPGDAVPHDWTEGYAVLPAFGIRAHWFKREAPRAMSIDGVPTLATPVTTECGHTRFETQTSSLMFAGSFEMCQRCAAARGVSK